MKNLWKTWCYAVIFALSCQMAVAAEKPVTVFAAASLTNALNDIQKLYQQKYAGEKVELSYASSSVLAKQIEQGASADIFISADQKWMDYLADKNLINTDSRYTLLGNSLVLIAPVKSKIEHVDINANTDWQSLLGDNYLASGDPDHVPVGIYLKESLQNLGSWDKLKTKIAKANNVRNALLLVEREESPLGVVYQTDAAVSKQVKIVGVFPTDSYKKVSYPIAIINNSKGKEVEQFYQFIKQDEAKKVFQQYGFIVY